MADDTRAFACALDAMSVSTEMEEGAVGTRYLAIVEDLRAEGASLDQVIRNLMPNDFDIETQSPGWKIRDQVRHLKFFDRVGVQAVQNPLTFTRDRIKERGDK